MAGARLAFALLVAVHRVAAQTAPTVFEGVGPLTAQASGGQLLTFTGSFPANLHTHYCEWHIIRGLPEEFVRSTATVHEINAQGIGPRLTCLSPAWPFPAGAANLTVQYNNVDGSFRSRVWGFEFFEVVTGVSPAGAPSVGQQLITVTGAGFHHLESTAGILQPGQGWIGEWLDPAPGTEGQAAAWQPSEASFAYTLHLQAGSLDVEVPAVAVSPTTVVAAQPLWPYPPMNTNLTLHRAGVVLKQARPAAAALPGASTSTVTTDALIYTIQAWCEDTAEDDFSVVSLFTRGKSPADGEFSIALGETALQPRIPILLGQPSTTAAALLTAVQSVSAPNTVTVHAYAHERTTGYSTLTLLVRRKVVLGQPPLATDFEVVDLAFNGTTNDTTYILYPGHGIARVLSHGVSVSRRCRHCPPLMASGWNHVMVAAPEEGLDTSILTRPVCFGDNRNRQCEPPFSFQTASPVAVAAGKDYSCGIRPSGIARCWGPEPPAALDKMGTPPSIPLNSIAPGAFHTCATRMDWSLRCWGDPMYSRSNPPGSECEQVSEVIRQLWPACSTPTFHSYMLATSGTEHSCAIALNGLHVVCWGGYRNAQTGQIRARDEWGNPIFGNAGPYREVRAGLDFTCALRTDGVPECWGANDYGQSCPPAGHRFVQLAVGFQHACALEAGTERVHCWGRNTDGEARSPIGNFLWVTAGESHSCGLMRVPTGSSFIRAIRCWGKFWGSPDPSDGSTVERPHANSTGGEARMWMPNNQNIRVHPKCTITLDECTSVSTNCRPSRLPCTSANDAQKDWPASLVALTAGGIVAYFLFFQRAYIKNPLAHLMEESGKSRGGH